MQTDAYVNLVDGYIIDLYYHPVYVACYEMVNVSERFVIQNESGMREVIANRTAGFYCISATPKNCHGHAVPGTDYSKTTRLIEDGSRIVITVAAQPFRGSELSLLTVLSAVVLLVDIGIMVWLIQKKSKTLGSRSIIDGQSGIPSGPGKKLIVPSSSISIVLLYSIGSRHVVSSVDSFKQSLTQQLPHYKIEDAANVDQWEEVGTRGLGWFISRIVDHNVRLVIIDLLEEDNVAWNVPGLTDLAQVISSMATLSVVDYRRIFVVQLDITTEKMTPDVFRFRETQLSTLTPFTRFTLPNDWDILIQHMAG